MKKYKPTHKRIRRGEDYIINARKKALLGIMDLLILQWVKENPICGQDIMNRIFNEFNVKIGPGTMYPILFSLKKQNLVSTKLKNKIKLYFLTRKGKAVTRSMLKDYSKIQNDLEQFLMERKPSLRKRFKSFLRK